MPGAPPPPRPDWPGRFATPATVQPVLGEARLLTAERPIPLMHPVDRIVRVYGFASDGTRMDYRRGRDWEADHAGIRRTSNSRIPDFGTYRYRGRGTGDRRFEFDANPRNPPRTLPYVTYIDYRASIPDPVVTARGLRFAPRRILCLGDSIVGGADTVARNAFGSAADSACGLLGHWLGARATVRIASTPGGSLQPIWAHLEHYLSGDPDTVILAFGMNDHRVDALTPPEEFARQLESVTRRVLAQRRNLLLVGFFQSNPLFARERPDRTQAFNAAIAAVARTHDVPYIDIASAFESASPGASAFLHLTGDFLHHPNSYGQRIYFSLLAPYFLRRDTAARAIDGYVTGPWTE